jgi:hypothetical protein
MSFSTRREVRCSHAPPTDQPSAFECRLQLCVCGRHLHLWQCGDDFLFGEVDVLQRKRSSSNLAMALSPKYIAHRQSGQSCANNSVTGSIFRSHDTNETISPIAAGSRRTGSEKPSSILPRRHEYCAPAEPNWSRSLLAMLRPFFPQQSLTNRRAVPSKRRHQSQRSPGNAGFQFTNWA